MQASTVDAWAKAVISILCFEPHFSVCSLTSKWAELRRPCSPMLQEEVSPGRLWVLGKAALWLWTQDLRKVLHLPGTRSLSAHKDRVNTWPHFSVLSFLRSPVSGLTGAFCLYQSFPPAW